MIERCDLLGHRHRMAQRQEIDRCAERQSPTHHCGLRQLQEGIKDGHRKGDVVAAPKRVVAGGVDQFDQGAQLVDTRQPGPGRWFVTTVNGDKANAQLVVQNQVHRVGLLAVDAIADRPTIMASIMPRPTPSRLPAVVGGRRGCPWRIGGQGKVNKAEALAMLRRSRCLWVGGPICERLCHRWPPTGDLPRSSNRYDFSRVVVALNLWLTASRKI